MPDCFCHGARVHSIPTLSTCVMPGHAMGYSQRGVARKSLNLSCLRALLMRDSCHFGFGSRIGIFDRECRVVFRRVMTSDLLVLMLSAVEQGMDDQ